MATGGGKTVIFCFMTKQASEKGLRVMILAHRAEILDQIDETLSKFGITAGHIRAGKPMDKTKRVFVASVQTLVRRLDDAPVPDLVICDECHHAAAGQYVQIFAHYSKSKFVGVTATPERLDGKGLGDFFDRMVLGPQAGWLIDNGFLKRPIYIGTSNPVDMSGVHKVAGEYNKAESAEAMDKKVITGDAVAHYRQFGRGMPAVAFCVNLKHAASVESQFNAAGLRAEIIDGTMTADERRARKARLADGTTRVMVSCELVSEGFDLPCVGVGILLRPTASLSLHLQQLGRPLRAHPGQDVAIILDHAGNTLRHGPAEEERGWSLEGNAAKKRKKEVAIETRQCDKCYAIFQGTLCPQCGTTRESKAREIEIQEGQLREIDAAVLMERRNKRTEEGKCRTLQDFQALGKARNYSPGWAWFRWQNSRHFKAQANQKPTIA